jgi:predicted RNA binding protein YcfA (HicA-like mRNA interferase family)
MTRLPVLKPSELIAALKRAGYVIDHQSGSHVVLYNAGAIPISVPLHNRDMKKGTLQHILRAAGMSVDELVNLLH